MRFYLKRATSHKSPATSSGFTLIELLVALTILALIITLMLLGAGIQLSRGEDARRKADLAKFKIGFEDYYNDHRCYPPPALLQRCGSSDLAPYIAKVPCDPRTKQPYPYYWDGSCQWYAAYTTLEDTSDPVITTLGCSPTCGVPNQPYNYVQSNGKYSVSQMASYISGGVMQTLVPTPTPSPGGGGLPTATPTAAPTQPPGGGNPTPTPGGGNPTPTPTPAPSPTPTPNMNNLACDPSGQCNVYNDPNGSGCPVTFSDPTACQQACADPANRCAR
jgi:prepilin-type N-terminal cleavage/methylation domain-containing protein